MAMKSSPFPGFSPKALTFFKQLEKNNSREWFTPRKEQFEELLRGPMIELVGQIVDDLRGFAVDHVIDPKKALFRIYRDTRFSKDKTPYKTQLAAQFPRAKMPKYAAAAFYFSVSHKQVEIAGGMYMPGPEELAAVREAIGADEKTFRELTTAKALVKALGPLQGEKMARVPKGYSPDHPAADLLRLKQFYFYVTLPAERAIKLGLRKEIVHNFRLLCPFVNYINEAILKKVRNEDDAVPAIPKRPAPMF